jgi:Mlc titration factor MtfA (ptsG expression regulator)
VATSTPPAALVASASDRLPELAPLLDGTLRTYLALRYGAGAGTPESALRRALASDVRRVEARLARRARELRWPTLDAAERAALQAHPWYHEIPPALRDRIERLARRFLDTVPLVGCEGFVIDARVRALIAFPACLLVATRDLSFYRSLRSVLVYADEFVVREKFEDEDGIVHERERPLSGQTEDDSRILISWADVQHGLAAGDGYNVVLHEFAHFLDHVSGGQLSGAGTEDWRAVFDAEYAALQAAVDAGHETLIDPYGAEDEAEFFAVCTEVFFELPEHLRAEHPGLYAALTRFYGMDPAGWVNAPAGPGP